MDERRCRDFFRELLNLCQTYDVSIEADEDSGIIVVQNHPDKETAIPVVSHLRVTSEGITADVHTKVRLGR